MSTSALAPAAQDEIATLFVGFELSKATWLIGLYSPQLGKTISRYKVDGGDVDAALERITVARLRLEKLGKPVRVVSIYEAGYDGFWLHRRLTAAGIENRVVDAASIPVERRSRRRKTDRIDLELLIRMLLALERGETRICRVIQVPTPIFYWPVASTVRSSAAPMRAIPGASLPGNLARCTPSSGCRTSAWPQCSRENTPPPPPPAQLRLKAVTIRAVAPRFSTVSVLIRAFCPRGPRSHDLFVIGAGAGGSNGPLLEKTTCSFL